MNDQNLVSDQNIRVRKAPGTWSVRAAGAVIAESVHAIELSEGALEPVIYFPRSDVAMALLEPSDTTSNSLHLGDASYYSIYTTSKILNDAVWSYEAPLDTVAKIAGLLAFRGEDVTVERL